ncbi:glycosyltransferase family 2 protein [uncultured Christiangramia sp.]|uniref:glycosyltransferase family 2 protein n=1 Tax=uncultured Christiangramia sp. TaxID=503836 RepID=UPI002626CF7C|nr:glycosyltransferase family 2 protein [uncultured Christiangramia sp.]
MDNKPVVSIIIPFYNRFEYLKDTLLSIINQTFVDYEVIIVDDGSEPEIIRKASLFCDKLDFRFKFLQRPANYSKGANGCRDFGYTKSQGEYIKWFDSDDLMKTDFIEIQLEKIIAHQLDGVFAECKVYNQDFTVVLRDNWRKKSYSENILSDYLKTQMGWQTGSGLWRKKSIGHLEPFKQNIKNAQEWIFHLYILTENLQLGVIQKELFMMRSHSDSISGQKSKDYYRNKLIARTLAFNRLIATGNHGKSYLLKYFVSQLMKSDGKEKTELLKIVFENLKFKFGPNKKSSLIKIKI